MRTVKPKSLCRECSNAHVQYGVNGERAISCTYGGMVRVVKLMFSIAPTTATATRSLVQLESDSNWFAKLRLNCQSAHEACCLRERLPTLLQVRRGWGYPD